MNQSHNQFKVFVGSVEQIEEFFGKIEDFASSREAKSIGVEYLEKQKRLVVTLGYVEGEGSYPVSLHVRSLDQMADYGEDADYSDLELAMNQAARSVERVICHELFITEDGLFFMVMMALR